MSNEKLMGLIRLSLWGSGSSAANRELFEEMKRHTIAALPASCLPSLGLSDDLQEEWKTYILQQLASYAQCRYEQSILPISIPFVILKGTSAAKYYPYPDYRMMGDIDIMTRREDLDKAYHQLIDNGYIVIKELNREICLIKNGIGVELHRRFATLSDPEKAKYLDDLIIDNINPSHVLPDSINGLVILEHINQHMEGGIGFRQIIDWMMFVDKCLPDEKWPEFYPMAKEIGLEKLAIVTTRMCEIYLGLSNHAWCADADPAICEQLLNYISSCGNFGNKKTSDTAISENAFAFASTPKMAFKLLQKQGLSNWKATQTYAILRPFAWIYQAFRYAVKGLKRDRAVSRIRTEYSAAMKRNAMFSALGIKTMAKGDIVYKNGQYIKK